MAKMLKVNNASSVTWENVLQQFLWWKQAQALAQRTLDDYREHISRFFKRYPDSF